MRIKHEPVTSPDKQKRAQRKLVIKTAIILGAVFSLVAGGLYGAHSERVRVAHVYIQGEKVIPEKEILDVVEGQLAGSYAWVLPHDVAFLYPRKKITKNILDTFKRVSDVDVRFVGLTEMSVTVTERQVFALWCGEELKTVERDSTVPCYFMDRDGFIFAKAPHFSQNVYHEYYGQLQGAVRGTPIGKTFLNTDDLNRIISFIDDLDIAGIPVYMLDAKDGGVYEVYPSDEGAILTQGKIVFNADDDYRNILHNLIAGLSTKRGERGVEDGVLEGLDYIDLRFENKVLFKFLD